MRSWWSALALALVLSGCMVSDDPPTQSDDAAGSASATSTGGNATTVSMTLTRSPAPTGNGTAAPDGNATAGDGNVTGNATGNATANQTAPAPALVHEESFSGLLPVDGLTATHPFEVPAGAVRVEVTYTSDHVGLFTALAAVNDPGGERLTSSDACGFGSTGAETDVCLMLVDTDVGAGTWSVDITWQVGQATEEYTFDVRVFGIPA